jgi:hypothetical protein
VSIKNDSIITLVILFIAAWKNEANVQVSIKNYSIILLVILFNAAWTNEANVQVSIKNYSIIPLVILFNAAWKNEANVQVSILPIKFLRQAFFVLRVTIACAEPRRFVKLKCTKKSIWILNCKNITTTIAAIQSMKVKALLWINARAIPTILSYNASAVKNYKTTNNLTRSKYNSFFYVDKTL